MESYKQTNAEISREVQWFMETLEEVFHVTVAIEEIGLEATELSTEEVEDFYVPRELFTEVPTTFLYEVMIVDDDQGNEWIGAVAYYPNTPDWCLQIITKNGTLLIRNSISNI
ncbi:hypothetical protein [Metaplanococcus flavidus]|uniref:Uncharacterized protein n=1 Tax=Metaplanococcus flavidus TaxID=569883 RepID=A0ABW3LEF1_9BACL